MLVQIPKSSDFLAVEATSIKQVQVYQSIPSSVNPETSAVNPEFYQLEVVYLDFNGTMQIAQSNHSTSASDWIREADRIKWEVNHG